MACASQIKRRLLFQIIRSPTLSHHTLPPQCVTQYRCISTAQPRSNDGFSITFGSKIDDLLESHGSADVSKTSSKTRGKKKTSRTTSGQKISGSGGREDNVSVNYVRENAISDIERPTVQELGLQEKRNANDISSEAANPSESVTIELSEDAYDEISRPQSKRSTTTTEATRRKNDSRDNAQAGQEQRASIDRNKGTVSTPTTKPRKKLESWQIQKQALKEKFGEEGWKPRKKLSPDAMEGIRSLHDQDPERYSTEILSQQFKVSPEAIRRILKSKWRPSAEVMEDRRARWARRHDRIWDQKAALGLRTPRKRDKVPDSLEAFEEELHAKKMLEGL